MESVRIAVAGTGLMGRRHVEAIEACHGVAVSAVVDPDERGKAYAEEMGFRWYPSLEQLFDGDHPDGVVLATPNKVHVANALACVRAGFPTLVEKPLATSADEAESLVSTAKSLKVPILVGHHRRHNPLIQRAHEMICAGELGDIRVVHINFWLYKPDDYFDEAPWRKSHGAGPVSVNLIHDVNLMLYLCGDVVSVHAECSPSARGYDNEDVAVAVLRFQNGALGTLSVSDAVVAPWSWELTARENPVYAPTSQSCYMIGGTERSLSIPDLTLWEHKGKKSWWSPLCATSVPRGVEDPLIRQLHHFVSVIKGEEEPLVSAEEGMRTLRIVEAIQRSAESGRPIRLDREACGQ